MAGRVTVECKGELLGGAVAVIVTVLGIGVVLGPPRGCLGLVLLGLVLVPYISLFVLGPNRIARHHYLLEAARSFLQAALAQEHKAARHDQTPPQGSWADVLSVVPAVAFMLASFGMVRSAVDLAARWQWPHSVLGVSILATLTGIPNVLSAVRLARRARGSAAVSESFNSNNLNVLAGICLPAVVIGLGPASGPTVVAAWYLLSMTLLTVLTVALAVYSGGLSRWQVIVLVVVYLGLMAWIPA